MSEHLANDGIAPNDGERVRVLLLDSKGKFEIIAEYRAATSEFEQVCGEGEAVRPAHTNPRWQWPSDIYSWTRPLPAK